MENAAASNINMHKYEYTVRPPLLSSLRHSLKSPPKVLLKSGFLIYAVWLIREQNRMGKWNNFETRPAVWSWGMYFLSLAVVLHRHFKAWTLPSARETFSQRKLYRQYFSSVIQANVIKPELSLHRKHSSNNPLWPLPNVLLKMPKNASEIPICWGSLFDAHVLFFCRGITDQNIAPDPSLQTTERDWRTLTSRQTQYQITWLQCGNSVLVSMTTLCVGFQWWCDTSVYISCC